ncbi:Hypothetical predicted protein [Mytilus galloprovincialis]|uniref:Uncharacterized protein n=1 Tax=Mytilus galloprovincialis TaxID=29158 RepID=A0A8B6BWT5_MYTGA|nr:Hypothetical predicted protein [Mytilus galloprovincialis]
MHASIFDDRCRVFVRFASDNLGGWQSGTNELYPNRKFEDGNCEVEGQVDLPRGFKDKQIAYKYFIACGNKEQQEFVYNQKDNLRCLYVTSKQLKSLNGKKN